MWKTFYKLYKIATNNASDIEALNKIAMILITTDTSLNFIVQLFFYFTFLENSKPGSTQLFILFTSL